MQKATDESPVYFEAGGHTLFGIVTHPQTRANGDGVVLLPGSGQTSTHRNRMSVHLARRLAGDGYTVLRFDYHGVGNSSGSVESYRLDRPFVQDLLGAVGFLRESGARHLTVVGTCFGARTALAALDDLADIDALVLVNTHVTDFDRREQAAILAARQWSLKDYVRRALSPRGVAGLFDRDRRKRYRTFWDARMRGGRRSSTGSIGRAESGASPHFTRPLQLAVRRRVPMLFLYGSQDACCREFQSLRASFLPDDDMSGVAVQITDHRVAGFPSLEGQRWVIDAIVAWLRAGRAASL